MYDEHTMTPSLVLRQLAYARARSATRDQQVKAAHLRIEETKLELSMLMEELRELEAEKERADEMVGIIKSFMDEHRIVEQPLRR